ncbi:hypothetical protein Tco_1214085 [Tanacetum coccineum]
MSTFDGICHQTFRAAKTSLDTAESDSDDEEEYVIQRNKFRASIYDPLNRSLALQEVLNPFRKICVWKKVVSFLGYVALQHVEWKPDYTRCFNRKEDSDGQWHAEIRLTDPDLDTTTLRVLIDSKDRLIPEAPQPGVPRVAILRPQRASMQDWYERMGSMEIRGKGYHTKRQKTKQKNDKSRHGMEKL